jgi:hypothetical protein
MIVYLAGVLNAGNLKEFWKYFMNLYLAGTYSRPFIFEETMKLYLAGAGCHGWGKTGSENYMKLYLAGIQGKAKDFVFNDTRPYILESYFYIKDQSEWIDKLKPFFKNFLLDSGAFTYLNGAKANVNWDNYIEQYADFINKHNIDLFIELDIDSVVGLKEVERLRIKLENLTNKKCIPVWHKSRGLDYWEQMTKNYNYVAIGGIVTQEIKRTEYDIFKPLLKIAYKNNCKVHGLGFTNLQGLKKYKFYSVDSTAWVYGNRGGYLYKFNGETIIKIQPKGLRLKSKEGAIHNFSEWLKFSQYAENNL